jgi:hypothetical protein
LCKECVTLVLDLFVPGIVLITLFLIYPIAEQFRNFFQVTDEAVLFVFNPITGQPLAQADGLISLGYKVKQSFLLHEGGKESLRGILMLDSQDNLHVYPESAQSVAVAMATTSFIFTADSDTGLLAGYSLALSTEQVSISG